MQGSGVGEAVIRRRLRVTGAVQGVGFRVTCARMARGLGLAGRVRNQVDGSVEVVVQGPPEAVAQVVAWCRHGPAGARVDAVEVAEAPPEDDLPAFAVVSCGGSGGGR
ncbi:MAG: acylphosphatase, partial [Acidimicrobiales bacterium]